MIDAKIKNKQNSINTQQSYIFNKDINNKTKIIDYIIQKLRFRMDILKKSDQALSNILSFEMFLENKHEIKKIFTDTEEDIQQGIDALTTLLRVNQDLDEDNIKIKESLFCKEEGQRLFQMKCEDLTNVIKEQNKNLRIYKEEADKQMRIINEYDDLVRKSNEEKVKLKEINLILLKEKISLVEELSQIKEGKDGTEVENTQETMLKKERIENREENNIVIADNTSYENDMEGLNKLNRILYLIKQHPEKENIIIEKYGVNYINKLLNTQDSSKEIISEVEKILNSINAINKNDSQSMNQIKNEGKEYKFNNNILDSPNQRINPRNLYQIEELDYEEENIKHIPSRFIKENQEKQENDKRLNTISTSNMRRDYYDSNYNNEDMKQINHYRISSNNHNLRSKILESTSHSKKIIPIIKGGVKFETCLRNYSSKSKDKDKCKDKEKQNTKYNQKDKKFISYTSPYGKYFDKGIVYGGESDLYKKNNLKERERDEKSRFIKVDNTSNIKIEDETAMLDINN